MELQPREQVPRRSEALCGRSHHEDEVSSPLVGQSIEVVNSSSIRDRSDRNFSSATTEIVAPLKSPSITGSEAPASLTTKGGSQLTNKPVSAPQAVLQPNRASPGDPSQYRIPRRNLVSEHRNHRILKGAMNSLLPKAFQKQPKSHPVNRAGFRLLGGTQSLAQHVIRHFIEHRRRSGTTLAERLHSSELSVVMQNHPKYQQLLRAVPVLVGLLPNNIRDGLTSKEGTALIEFGVLVAEKLVSRTLST